MIKKRNKILTKSVSGLIVAILAITAFVRGNAQVWCYAIAFTVFAAVCIYALAAAHRQRKQYARRKKQTAQRVQNEESTFDFPLLDAPSDSVLLQHVNHRISAYLKTTYPDVTWEWVTENPAEVIKANDKGHIKVFGAGEFNECLVTFGERARIIFHMMRVVSLADVQGGGAGAQERVSSSLPVDVGAWYGTSGKAVLADLIADLESRGHSKLIIKENGDICVTQDKREVVQDTLFNMPEAVHWPHLAKVMVNNGLDATVEDAGIVVGW